MAEPAVSSADTAAPPPAGVHVLPQCGEKRRRRSRSRSLVRARKRRRAAGGEGAQYGNIESIAARPRRRSSDFEQYAAAQGLVPHEEKHAFFSVLRRPLPLAFRIRSCDEVGAGKEGTSAEQEWEELRTLCTTADVECRRITGVDGAWQITLGRDELYQPHLYRLRTWLTSSTASGRIVRQEAVSMIPVMLLRIRRQHAVLDMCASPGSKTSQALDALYDDSATGDQKADVGFVIANDSDAERGYVLAKRLTGLGRRACSAMVVNHDGTKFPNVLAPLRRRLPDPQLPYSRGAFDRIICDVPCSGDGTIRKDHKVWRVWHPGYGHSLHPLQLRIAMRGVSLLKVGGLMTYSTCSFNPIENEAVVAALLERGRGCLELVDPSPILRDHFAWRTGWTTWTVLDDDFVTHAEPSAAPQLPKTIWPPQSQNIANALNRCVRMMPHDNDTGGFFIALLRKKAELPAPTWLRTNQREDGRIPTVSSQPDHHRWRPIPFKLQERAATSSQHDRFDSLGQPLRQYARSDAYRRWFGVSASLAAHAFDSIGSARLNIVSAGVVTHTSEGLGTPVPIVQWQDGERTVQIKVCLPYAQSSADLKLSATAYEVTVEYTCCKTQPLVIVMPTTIDLTCPVQSKFHKRQRLLRVCLPTTECSMQEAARPRSE